MRTKTYYWPNEKLPEVEMEVTRDGTIYSALAYSSALDCMLDCTMEIKERSVWVERAQAFSENAEWNERDDVSFEIWRESVADIIGAKTS
jgi:hypothetical protein